MKVLTPLVLTSLLALAATVPVRHTDLLQSILLTSTTPDSLRARMLALATSTPGRHQKSDALYYRGLSFERDAMLDSAIANYRRATEASRTPLPTNALLDGLLRRRADHDVAEAITLLEAMGTDEQQTAMEGAHADPARLGWAYVLSGDAKRGLALLKPQESRLAQDSEWRYRFARAYLGAGATGPAVQYLTVLNAAARGQDKEIAGLIKHLDAKLGENARVAQRAGEVMKAHDDQEMALLGRLGGRRVRVASSDGALLGGALFLDRNAPQRTRAAVLLAAHGDELADYDSLTSALRSSGFSVFLLDPRGSGWSVAPEFPLPDTWVGRENALAARVAVDLSDGLDAFVRTANIDSTHVVLIGVGSTAPIAVQAAAADPRFTALVLLDPWTSPVDRGATLDAARRTGRPAYIQLSVPGRSEALFADTLFHSYTPRTSRIVESTALGAGPQAFGSRPDVTPRLIRWLDETVAPPPGTRSTPRKKG